MIFLPDHRQEVAIIGFARLAHPIKRMEPLIFQSSRGDFKDAATKRKVNCFTNHDHFTSP